MLIRGSLNNPLFGPPLRSSRSGVPQLRSWDFMSLRMESGMSHLGYPSRPGSPNVDSGRDLFLFTTSPAGISQMTGSQMSILDCICSFSEICQLGYPSRPGRWNLKSGRVSFLFQISKWPYGPPGPQNVKNRQIAKTDQT